MSILSNPEQDEGFNSFKSKCPAANCTSSCCNKDYPMLDNFQKDHTFDCSKNATLLAVGTGFDDSFLAFLLLYLVNSLEDPVWSMASTNIATSDVPINKWSFNQVAGKLRKAMHNNIHPAEASSSGTNQLALNAVTNKPTLGRYSRPPCTYAGCLKPKTHSTERCHAKERDEKNKEKDKRHKAKRAKKKAAVSSSESESGSDSSDSESEHTQKKRHHAKTLRNLKATVVRASSYHGKTSGDNLFITHPDSGASNHMTHKMELFDQSTFKKLSSLYP